MEELAAHITQKAPMGGIIPTASLATDCTGHPGTTVLVEGLLYPSLSGRLQKPFYRVCIWASTITGNCFVIFFFSYHLLELFYAPLSWYNTVVSGRRFQTFNLTPNSH